MNKSSILLPPLDVDCPPCADSQGGISGIRGLERGSPVLRGVPQKTDQTGEARTMAGVENEKTTDVYYGERE